MRMNQRRPGMSKTMQQLTHCRSKQLMLRQALNIKQIMHVRTDKNIDSFKGNSWFGDMDFKKRNLEDIWIGVPFWSNAKNDRASCGSRGAVVVYCHPMKYDPGSVVVDDGVSMVIWNSCRRAALLDR